MCVSCMQYVLWLVHSGTENGDNYCHHCRRQIVGGGIRHVRCNFVYIAHKCDNFIVGLTNVSPDISKPTLYNYTLCGQYPGAVPNGTTVSLSCQDNLPPFRYVILQIPLSGHLVTCEVEVLARGRRISNINILSSVWHSSRLLFGVVISIVASCSTAAAVKYVPVVYTPPQIFKLHFSK